MATDEQVVDAAKWLQSLTPDQLAEARFYADVESFRKRCAELESELAIERGRVESWKKDSHTKEKLLNEKCEEVAAMRRDRDLAVEERDRLASDRGHLVDELTKVKAELTEHRAEAERWQTQYEDLLAQIGGVSPGG